MKVCKRCSSEALSLPKVQGLSLSVARSVMLHFSTAVDN